mmetsp:Transcript_35704/g.65454  ORF Transcript_35704/g.65454 Transcript_35704/m.65454 type:complete len:105 (+) Transcript_35704:359-673(+)
MVSTLTPISRASSSNIGNARLAPVLLHVGPKHTTTVLPLSSGSANSFVGWEICCVVIGGVRKALVVANLNERKRDTIDETLMLGDILTIQTDPRQNKNQEQKRR